MSTVDYNAWNPEKKRCSYHNKQSPREFRVLLQLILSVMSAIYGWDSGVKSCSDCQIRHAYIVTTHKIMTQPNANVQYAKSNISYTASKVPAPTDIAVIHENEALQM